jgi:arylformamidase
MTLQDTQYTREFCEPQYDPHTTAPDGKEVMQRRLSLAAKAREKFDAHYDIPYGTTAKERVDIYRARGVSQAVMVFIHGGYWQRLDKRDLAFLAESFVNAGVTLVQVNYDLAPEVTLDEIVREVRDACAWVWHNVNNYGGDRNRIYVGGNSAGGHLAAMMAATDWKTVHADLPADLVKGGLLVSGIYDLEPIRFTSINDAVGMDSVTAARNSPVNLLPASSGPLLVAVGELESSEFQRQSRLIVDAWRAVRFDIMVVPRCHHYNILLQLADATSPFFAATAKLMQLRGEQQQAKRRAT